MTSSGRRYEAASPITVLDFTKGHDNNGKSSFRPGDSSKAWPVQLQEGDGNIAATSSQTELTLINKKKRLSKHQSSAPLLKLEKLSSFKLAANGVVRYSTNPVKDGMNQLSNE